MKSLGKTLFLAFLISCCCYAGAHAGWIENGVLLTHRESSASWGRAIVSDGSSGAIIAYPVCGGIIAQHVDSLGVALWGEEGIDFCPASGQNPQITSDGVGGAIIAWTNYSAGNGDVYVQRLNGSGVVLWTANGVALCTATGEQDLLSVVSDGAGGAIATWMDYRSGNYDIYAQRVNASGVVQWTTNGVPLCTATGNQLPSTLVSDGTGGAIATWQDNRSGNTDIYAQRVNASGAVQWTANGVALCTATGSQYSPTTTSDGAGGAIVTWYDYRSGNTDIYAQRVNASGAVQWATDGVALCTATGDQDNPHIVSDGAGGAIVTWDDRRSWGDIYAQRVNGSGDILWPPNGVALCEGMGARYPEITSDGVGGAIVTWQDYRSWNNYDIYAQRVNPSGAVQWVMNGVPLCAATGDQNSPMITSDGAGGVIVTWFDNRSGRPDIYAQRVNTSGAVRWAADGVALCTATGHQENPTIMSDGAGGAIVSWTDSLSGSGDIYAQRVNTSGSIQWTINGVALCTAPGDQRLSILVSDGAGGAIVAWLDNRSGNYAIYAQRVNASGVVQWTLNGVALCAAGGGRGALTITSDGTGGAIVTWEDFRSGNYDIYAQRVNASGAVQWTANGVALCTATGSQYSPTITSDGAGGAIVTWADNRIGNYDIYAQRVNASGTTQWTANGVALCIATGSQYSPTITSDGASGAIVTWDDYRGGNYAIYAQRVNASGVVQWMLNGVALCTATGLWSWPMITSDGAGGAIVTWNDYRTGHYDIYAQRVNASGVVQWTLNGVALCTEMGDQYSHEVIADGAGGVIAAWVDYKYGTFDSAAHVQRVNALGQIQWIGDRVPVSLSMEYDAGGWAWARITGDGGGGAIVAWTDSRCGTSLIYAQRVDAAGHISPETATLLQNYSAATAGTSIRIDWTLSEIDDGAHFFIYRASVPHGKYAELDGSAIAQDRLAFTFTDGACVPGTSYKYRVECEVEGTGRRILFETDAITIPTLPVTLDQNHPNPFNPQTVIRFYLPEAQEIFLDIYNVAGERVARLAEGRTEKGYHEVTWDGRNASGTVCSSGVYFSRLVAGKSTISRKMVIIR